MRLARENENWLRVKGECISAFMAWRNRFYNFPSGSTTPMETTTPTVRGTVTLEAISLFCTFSYLVYHGIWFTYIIPGTLSMGGAANV
jgi:hypothetical protein